MGYTTDFKGKFKLDKPLNIKQFAYLNAFSKSRRMARDAKKADKMDDPLRVAVNLPVGEQGGYFVGQAKNNYGQDHDDSILDYNGAPKGQPGLWCQWVPTEDGEAIEWDGGEKFYDYVGWLRYIIANFLQPWGLTLNGRVTWEGEDRSDVGTIVVKDNEVSTIEGTKYEDDEDEAGPKEYNKEQVIAALERIKEHATSALRAIKTKKDPSADFEGLHVEVNDLYEAIDEGTAEY